MQEFLPQEENENSYSDTTLFLCRKQENQSKKKQKPKKGFYLFIPISGSSYSSIFLLVPQTGIGPVSSR